MPLWGSLKRLHCDQGAANLVSKVIKSLCAILGTCHTTDGPPMIGPPRTIRGNCRCSIHSTVNGSPRTIHGAIDGSTLPLIVPSIFHEKKPNVCFFRSSIIIIFILRMSQMPSTHCFLRTEIRSICHKVVWL